MKNFTIIAFLLFSFFSFNTKLNAACVWKSKIAKFVTWDSCANNKSSLNGSLSLNAKGCFAYKWTVGGATVGTNATTVNYKITKNGTYTLCLKVTDTCNKCDTTLCATFTISCLKTCNWKGRFPYFYAWDTCNGSSGRNSVNAYISFNSSPNCFKYSWTVNGNATGKNKSIFNYPIANNGTYVICLKVTDTCNNCDTTFCSTRTITCFSSSSCKWKSNLSNFYAWDTCNGSGKRNSLNAYIAFKSGSCFKYLWSVNGVSAGTGYLLNYNIANNGTYSVCVKVYDTCNKCDTTLCSTRTITCFNTSSCNWKAKINNFFVWDTCKGSGGANSLNAYIAFKTTGCFKYQWAVNNVPAGNGNVLNHKIVNNGTYSVCVKVTDTCNKCDTTLCSTRTISCFTSCNWKSKTNYYFWDTCKGSTGNNSLNAYVALKSGSCYKYQWTVNNVPAGNGYILHYNIANNGTYSICVKVTDTCNKCDTTICATRIISCFGSAKCNWKSSNPYFYAWDTCNGTGGRNSVNAYISFTNKTCLKYAWSVNGVVRGGNGNVFGYPVNANGTYVICVKVTDTCNKCDTTFCSTRTISCFKTACNFKARVPYFSIWDSCAGNKATLSGYINFSNRSCLKYAWTLAGVAAGNNQSFAAPIFKNGTYVICVKVTDTCNSSRCDTTFCYTRGINCQGLGVKVNQHVIEDITVYPNPAKNIFYLDWSGNTSGFEVFNILGNLVYKGELGTGKNTIITDTWANGVYMIRVETGSGNRTLKIVVSR